MAAVFLLSACGGDDQDFTLGANNTGNVPGGGSPGSSKGPDAGGDVDVSDGIPADAVLFVTGAGDFAILASDAVPLFMSGDSVASGDVHLAPARDMLVWSNGTQLKLAAPDGSLSRTLTAPIDGAPVVHTPRFSPDGNAVFLVAGGGDAATIYRAPLDMDTVTPSRVSASAATCSVFRSISARGPSRVIAVRDSCDDPGDGGLFEVLTSTGTATPLLRNVPDAPGTILATALSSDRNTVYAWASGSFDTNGDLTADVEATGVYVIDVASEELTTYEPQIDGTVTGIAVQSGGVILGVQSENGDQNLVAVALGSGDVSALTTSGDARSPVTY